MRKILIALAAVAALAFAGTATSAGGITTAGGATVANGVVTLVSNTGDPTATDDASSLTFALPAGTSFADLKTLSTDYEVTAGGCGGGSPRFTVTLADGKSVFAYIGPPPSFDTCALNTWRSSGNLIGATALGTWDTSQELPGTNVSTYPAALAALGSAQVTSVALVVDGSWAVAGKLQTVLATNVRVNGLVFPSLERPLHGGNPAHACKAERRADPAGFRTRYGTNRSRANAFGKCVSGHAHARHEERGKHAGHGEHHGH